MTSSVAGQEHMTRATFRSLLEEILDVPPGTLQDTDTRDTVEDWSSLVDVKILALVASETGVQPDRSLQEFDSVGELLSMLEQRGALVG
jgi:acyl carrier protein